MEALYLLGATASGKHTASRLVAGALGAEIISIDSVKVYRRMDIGSAKPGPRQLAEVPHHLIDICDPGDVYSVGRFVEDAERAEAEVRSRGRIPFYVGGTALYYKAHFYGLFRGPAADPVLRDELVAVAREQGTPSLHAELQRIDPEAAGRIHENDLKRIVRAIEVFRKTGEPISLHQKQFDSPSRTGRVVWIERTREDLKARLSGRTARMFQAGLEEEVRGLLEGPWSKEGRGAVGYRETVDWIEGRCTREEAEERINRNTHRFVRRQMTWFRSLPEAKPLPVESDETAEGVAERLIRSYGL